MEEPKIAQPFPYSKEMEKGKYAWCACGKSANQPFCDGSHARKNTGMRPVKVTVEENKIVAWCGCKESAKKPFCDGSHSKLG